MPYLLRSRSSKRKKEKLPSSDEEKPIQKTRRKSHIIQDDCEEENDVISDDEDLDNITELLNSKDMFGKIIYRGLKTVLGQYSPDDDTLKEIVSTHLSPLHTELSKGKIAGSLSSECTSKTAKNLMKDMEREIDNEAPNPDKIALSNLSFEDKKECIKLYKILTSMEPFSSEEYLRIAKDISDRILSASKRNPNHIRRLEKIELRLKNTEYSNLDSLKEQILNLKANTFNKSIIYQKYLDLRSMGPTDSNYSTVKEWLDWAIRLPYSNYKKLFTASTPTQDEMSDLLSRAKSCFEKRIFGMAKLKEEILIFLHDLSMGISKSKNILLEGPPGVGKCLDPNEKIMMYNGSVQRAKNIKPGDQLMGDNSLPRTVFSVSSGTDEMYKVIPEYGESYIVNSVHILSLIYTRKPIITPISKYWEVKWYNSGGKLCIKKFNSITCAEEFITSISEDIYMDVSLPEYFKLAKRLKNRLYGYRKSIKFQPQSTDLNPYLLGFWLGTTPESNFNLDKLANNHLFSASEMATFYSKMNALLPKIPIEYKINTKQIRLNVLAGIIDACGKLEETHYVLVIYNGKIANDTLYLARTLGFYCIINKAIDWFEIKIFGKLTSIPIQVITRPESFNNTNVKRFHFEVEHLGQNKYCGFSISGNGRFLLKDGIVTHNTLIGKACAESFGWPFYRISCGGLEDSSLIKGQSRSWVGSSPSLFVHALCSLKCNNGILLLDEVEKMGTKAQEALLDVLDRTTNNEWRDVFLYELNIDISGLLIILTVNDISELIAPLKDRVQRFKISPYEKVEKLTILSKYILPEILLERKLKSDDITLTETASKRLLELCEKAESSNGGLREIKFNLSTIVSKIHMHVSLGKEGSEKVGLSFFLVSLDGGILAFPMTIDEKIINVLFPTNPISKKEDKAIDYYMYL
jgi:ATP-dependent Lon protease